MAEHEFADELATLVAKYSHVPRGARAAYLFTAIGALVVAEKGGIPTVRELGLGLEPLLRKLAESRLVTL
jgi:hypothetical protein